MKKEAIEQAIRDMCRERPISHDEIRRTIPASLVDINEAITSLLDKGALDRNSPGMYVTVTNNQEAKADAGKPELSYLLEFPRALAGMSRVSEYGARKYGRNTWRRVEKQRYIDALLRHTIAIGPNALGKDKESKLFHIWQVMWNAAAIAELIEEEMQCTSN